MRRNLGNCTVFARLRSPEDVLIMQCHKTTSPSFQGSQEVKKAKASPPFLLIIGKYIVLYTHSSIGRQWKGFLSTHRQPARLLSLFGRTVQ